MAWTSFDRWDFLGTKILLVLLAVVIPLITLVRPVVTWVTGGALVWEGNLGGVGPSTNPRCSRRARARSPGPAPRG